MVVGESCWAVGPLKVGAGTYLESSSEGVGVYALAVSGGDVAKGDDLKEFSTLVEHVEVVAIVMLG